MAFRNIVINSRCKLSYSMNYLVVRKLDDEKRVLLDEIKMIIINSLEVSITTALISESSKRKIKIMFCNEKCNPECELISYQNNYYSYRKIKEQIAFDDKIKDFLWRKIIEEKIINQARNLKYMNLSKEYEMLMEYKDCLVDGDLSNREGHSAKVYFNSLFGTDFSRKKENDINKYLNYGYSIILSAISRSIKTLGYLSELGIHHIGESNQFNLSCDLIEPIRPLVDSLVIKNLVNDDNFKGEMIGLLAVKVNYRGKEYFLDNAIELYVEDMLGFMKTGELERISFIKYEL